MIKIKIRFLVFIFSIAIFAYVGGGNLPYSLLYTGLLVLVFGVIHIVLQRITMKIDLNLVSNDFKAGDILRLNVGVRSFSIIPAGYIIVKNEIISNLKKNYNGDVTYLNYKKEKKFVNELEFKIRGIYDFGVTNVLFTDLFCIMESKKQFLGGKSIKVYPKIYRVNENNFNGKNIVISENSNEIRDLRQYHEGDSLKRVHWKVSAKHNELYVKNFVEITSKDINIILNMNKDGENKEDYELMEEQIIDVAASIINYLQSKRFQVKLFVNNKEERVFNVGNQSEFEYLMEYFLNTKSQGEADLITFLDSKIATIKPKSWIGIITISVDEALKNEIMALTSIGFKVTVFYCSDNNIKFINERSTSGLEFIKCDKAIISLDE